MKNQYFGDINDYLKYGLLRALVRSTGGRVVVCWLLTPDDGGNDGRRIHYLEQEDRYRSFDPELFDLLRSSVHLKQRAIQSAERHGLIPGAIYYNELLSDGRQERDAYFAGFKAITPPQALVFFDPDNGLEIKSVPKGRKRSAKFLYLDEVEALHGRGHSIVVYQHVPFFCNRAEYIERQVTRVRAIVPTIGAAVIATPSVAFFVLADPSLAGGLSEGVEAVSTRWDAVVTQRGGPPCVFRYFPSQLRPA